MVDDVDSVLPPDSDGSEDFPDDGLVIRRGALGQAVILPTSVAKLSPHEYELAYAVQEAAMQLRDWRDLLDERVEHARVAGMSWSTVGFLVGTTGEAARQRWSPPSEPKPATKRRKR
jgi:hypothetical protein